MSTITETITPEFVKLELRTAYGAVFRDVSTAAPREARGDEIPVIDISGIYGDLEDRKKLAQSIKNVAEGTGFFYVTNHGVPEEAIEGAVKAAETFFKQPEEMKQLVSKNKGKWYNGYSAKNTAAASRTEGLDYRESFSWRYEPQYDPDPKDAAAVPDEVKPWIRGESYVWEGTSQLPEFKQGCLTYWRECLKLARRLIRIFALCLDLDEHHFDHLVTYPGSDGVFNYYPAMTADQAAVSHDIGLGSHTDLQCFTLLWQDMIGGLQVLSKDGYWIKASPLKGTFVVNIGDYLMRLTNDRLKSTVHRVYNRSTVDRYSMPFFFGFNFNEKCGVLPSCVDENHPAKWLLSVRFRSSVFASPSIIDTKTPSMMEIIKYSTSHDLAGSRLAGNTVLRPIELECVVSDVELNFFGKKNKTRKHSHGVHLGLANERQVLCIEQHAEVDSGGAHVGFRVSCEDIKMLGSAFSEKDDTWVVNLSILNKITSSFIVPETELDEENDHIVTVECWCTIGRNEQWEANTKLDIIFKDVSRSEAEILGVLDAIQKAATTTVTSHSLSVHTSTDTHHNTSSATSSLGFNETELAFLEGGITLAKLEIESDALPSADIRGEAWFDYSISSPQHCSLTQLGRGKTKSNWRGKSSKKGKGGMSCFHGTNRYNPQRSTHGSQWSAPAHTGPIAYRQLPSHARAVQHCHQTVAEIDAKVQGNTAVAAKWWNSANLATANSLEPKEVLRSSPKRQQLRRGGALFTQTMTGTLDL